MGFRLILVWSWKGIYHIICWHLYQVDFNKIASVTGQKYAKNARSAFKRLWDKLKAHDAREGVQVAGSGDDDAEAEAPKPKAKTALKKGVGLRKAPAKAAGPGRRSRRPTKKEREAAKIAVAEIKANAEAEDDADGEGDTTGITATEGDAGGESGSEGDAHAGQTGFPEYQENQENDELGAAMLNISVEEFRHLAEKSRYGNGNAPPTPKAYYSDED